MQILTDTHCHTVASTHAYSTVHDYFAAAKARGLQLFAVTDHAPTMPDGAHYWHFGNMRVLPRTVEGVALLRGIEANILPDAAAVDIPDNLVPFLDLAIASFHEPVFPPAGERTHTAAMIGAMATGKVQILGHPGNPNFPVRIDEVVRAAGDMNVAIEINNSSFNHSRKGSAGNCLRFLEAVERHGGKVVFASDSHSAWTLGEVSDSVAAAERAGLSPERVVNATPAKLLAFLAEHDKPVAAELAAWAAAL